MCVCVNIDDTDMNSVALYFKQNSVVTSVVDIIFTNKCPFGVAIHILKVHIILIMVDLSLIREHYGNQSIFYAVMCIHISFGRCFFILLHNT